MGSLIGVIRRDCCAAGSSRRVSAALLLLVMLLGATTKAMAEAHPNTDTSVFLHAGHGNGIRESANNDMERSIELLLSAGFRLCHPNEHHEYRTLGVPACSPFATQRADFVSRLLLESSNADIESTVPDEQGESGWWMNLAGAVTCVCFAAMAAGLTLGLLGIDPLLLLIKERAGETETERAQARSLLPIVKQHHLLLVTLLLMNSIASEALPIFLEALVAPSVAIVLSVTLVLFFGEIIPSAIFTGPNQLSLASALVPVVRTAMALLYPIAGPIAALLDIILHDNEDDSSGYNRGELAALIRIQYEERLANKRKMRLEKRRAAESLVIPGDHVGALDFSSTVVRDMDKEKLKRATKNHLAHELAHRLEPGVLRTASAAGTSPRTSIRSTSMQSDSESDNAENHTGFYERSPSIHFDEVIMAEGALQMKTKVALDVYTPMRKVFSIPADMKLSERNLVNIYASGFSRIPVYVQDNKLAICGLLMTRQLMVVNPQDKRLVNTLPLRRPNCVSPSTPLIHVLNLLQMGGDALKGGHLALVCARPSLASKALEEGQEVPEAAGIMGVITLEDVLEALLQEQIYDEMDRREQGSARLSQMVVKKWRHYVKRKKMGIPMTTGPAPKFKLLPVVEQVIDRAAHQELETSKTAVQQVREGVTVSEALEAAETASENAQDLESVYSNDVEEGNPPGETTALLIGVPNKKRSKKLVKSWFNASGV